MARNKILKPHAWGKTYMRESPITPPISHENLPYFFFLSWNCLRILSVGF